MRAAALKRQVAELVDDQQFRLGVKDQPVAQLPLGFGFRQRRQERRLENVASESCLEIPAEFEAFWCALSTSVRFALG